MFPEHGSGVCGSLHCDALDTKAMRAGNESVDVE